MAPFPEDEIITIKRLEIALRKSDFKALKEGAYKLHEKYHSHHHFEYLDLLKEILDEVQTNYAVPPEVKDILIPTIQDILSGNGQYQDESPNRISSLTSLSYGINNRQEQIEEPVVENKSETFDYSETKTQSEYIKPFQEFTPVKPIEMATNNNYSDDNYTIDMPEEENEDYKSIANSYNGMQTEDFDTDTPVIQQQNIFENKIEQEPQEFLSYKTAQEEEKEYIQQSFEDEEKTECIEEEREITEESVEEAEETEEYYNEPLQETEEEVEEEAVEETEENKQQESAEEIKYKYSEEIEEQEINDEIKQKSIAIFFAQDSSDEKIKNIEKYRSLIQNNSDFSLNEIISLINEIKTQADTNVSELQTFLEQLKLTNHNINLLTNSQSANLIDLFNQSDITYSIFNPTEDKRVNLLPLFGLTNLYKCFECNSEHLEVNEKINSFILQCPKCKHAMLPDLYSSKGKINIDYYNSCIIVLANSDTWLLVHPSLTEKLTLNMIRSALKVSSKVKEVYILDKDINVRETYRTIIKDINPDIKVSGDIGTTEDFFNNI